MSRPPIDTGDIGRPPAPRRRRTEGVRRRAQAGASCVREGDPRVPAEQIACGARVPRYLPRKLRSLRSIERFLARVSVSSRFSKV